MSHHTFRRLGWRRLVQWRMHLGQCNEFLYDEIIAAIAATFTPAAAARLAAVAARAVALTLAAGWPVQVRSGHGRQRGEW